MISLVHYIQLTNSFLITSYVIEFRDFMKSKENDGFHADSWLKAHPLPIHFLRSAMVSIYPSKKKSDERRAAWDTHLNSLLDAYHEYRKTITLK